MKTSTSTHLAGLHHQHQYYECFAILNSLTPSPSLSHFRLTTFPYTHKHTHTNTRRVLERSARREKRTEQFDKRKNEEGRRRDREEGQRETVDAQCKVNKQYKVVMGRQ